MKEYKWLSILVCFALVVSILGISADVAYAAPVDFTVWNFDIPPTPPTPPAPSTDITGNASAAFGTGLGSENYYSGNPGNAWSGNHWTETSVANAISAGDYFQFEVDLTSYGHITLSFDNRASSTGPTNYSIYYSLNGTDFFPTGVSGTTSPSFSASPMNSHDFGGGTAVDLAIRGQNNVSFRIYAWGGTSSLGTWRIDNVTFNATTNPTALTLSSLTSKSDNQVPLKLLAVGAALLLSGGLLILRRRKTV